MWAATGVGLVYALAVLGPCAATPLRRPLSVPKNLPRAALSSDPSCPDGYFCQQESCPGDVECPSGEECLNFEGHFACAPQGLKWCALNPSSLEAVGCGSGSCCHGNCYSSDAVCCDFPSIQCGIGQRCNVCSPGQHCSDGDCVDPNPGSTTTANPVPPPSTTTLTIKSIASSTTTRPTSSTTTTTTTTTKAPTTSVTSTTTTTTTRSTTTTHPSTSSTTSRASTTSSVQPSPTIVTDVGSFSFAGCYSDDADARVLVADSTDDGSSMTPEDCVNFAKKGAWRFAGVEYSSQCFVGNTIHDGSQEPDGDCNMACAGDSSESCGGGNRIQIYEDSTWKDPTIDELIAAIRSYNSTVEQAREVISTYYEHLGTLQDLMQSSSATKVKRDSPYDDIELQLMGDHDAATAASTSLDAAKSQGQRVLTIGRRLDTIDEADPEVGRNSLHAAADLLSGQLNDVITNLEANIAHLTDAISAGTTPAIDISASLATVNSAVCSLFLVMASLVGLFAGSGTGGQTTTLMPTTTTTATTTSTSTTSTCTSTATPTTVIVFTKAGASVSEFNKLVASLPKDPSSIQLTNSWQPNFMYVGEMDQCTAEALDDNALVDSWAIDALIDVEDSDTGDASTVTKRASNETANEHDTPSSEKRGNPTAQSAFFEQARSPSHLQWISQVSRYTALTGNYYSFDDLIYNDPDFTLGDAPIIYVIDTGFQNDHPVRRPDFADRVIAQLAVDDAGENIIPQTPALGSHGTCMVSLAAGSYSGMGKSARIVTAQLQVSIRGITHQTRCSRAFFLLMHIYHHVQENNARGKAVISMSFGVPRASLRWQVGNVNSRTVFDTIFDWYWSSGIATVASAGNDEQSDHPVTYKDLSSNLPRGAGGANTNLIVVGNSQWNTTRYPSSNYRDAGGLGILSLYNVGTGVECGLLDSAWGVDPPGTSQATAITAGMIAYYLRQPELYAAWTLGGVSNVPGRAKQYLLSTATQYKGTDFRGDSTPRAALGETVPLTAANLEPDYLQINPNGTIPSLIAPSLAKPLVESVEILEYLDRSRPNAASLTPTDSTDKARAQQLMDVVHSAQADTNIVLLQARSYEELEEKKKSPWMTFLSNRQSTLEKYQTQNPTHPFYTRKAAENGALLWLYTSDPSPEHKQFFERTHAQYRDFAALLNHLDSLLVLPFAVGSAVTVADLHIVPWLAHAMWGAGGHEINEFGPLERLIGVSVPGFRIGGRVKEWWANISQRESFRECYPSLH
ncbi:hypothetical protein BJY00DRAFT_303404 [Aspergillus carlsbadensis]|nr:hypothetical protein BJY00DRAFT_303404 [Aspergillus carlsbadensis]